MAYQKQSERVLSGGLSLLPPADKLNDGYAAQVQNFRSDQAGQLVSRRGMSAESAVLTSGPIHSLFRIGTDRYAGVGGELRRGTEIQTVLASGFDGNPLGIAAAQDNIWLMNQAKQLRHGGYGTRNWGIAAPTTAPVASPGAATSLPIVEFDQAEDWAVFYVGATEEETTRNATVEVVVTDSGTVTATNGSTAVTGLGTSWTPLMVGNSIRIFGAALDTFTTIASVGGPTAMTITGDYTDASEAAMAYSITRSVSVRNWDAVNKQSGTHSLHVAANPAGKYQVRKEEIGPVNLSLGASDPADIFQMWFYASRPQFISSIYIELYSGAGATRPLANAVIDPSLLNQGSFSWTQLDIRRGLDTWSVVGSNEEFTTLQQRAKEADEAGDGVQAATLRAAAQQLFDSILKNTPYFRKEDAFDWGAVTRMVVEVSVSDVCDFHLDRAQLIGGVTGPIDGEVSFYVTYANAEDHESNPSEPSVPINLKRQSATIAIPTSPDPQVDRRYIYRVGGGLSSPPYRVLIVYDNIATTCVTTVGNEEAQIENERLRLDNGLPPPARGLLGPYLGRLIAFNSIGHPNRYWYTPTAEPHKWEDANDENEGSWEDVGEAYEPIVGGTSHKRAVWFYKAKSIWRLSGDPETSTPEQTNSNIGLAAPLGLVNAGGYDFFYGGEGIYSFNGDFEQSVSEMIDPLFKGDYVQLGNVDIAPVNRDYESTCVLGLVNGRLRFSYPEPGRTSPSCTIECDLATKRWYFYRCGIGDGGFTALAYEGTGNQVLAGCNVPGGSRLFTLEDGADDGGQPIPVIWQSRYLDQGAPNTEKTYSDVVIEFKTAFGQQTPATLTVDAVFDNGTVVALGTIGSGTRVTRIFSLNLGSGLTASNFAIRVSGGATSTCYIYGVWIHWYIENRKGLSFDTGVVDLAGGDPAETDVFEAELTTTAPVDWKLFTDLPGSSLAQRLTSAIAQGSGRRTEPIRLAAKQTGRRGRLVFNSTGLFQMHTLRQRVRRFGEYVDGGKGQIWNPLPFRMSDGRIVQIKDLLLEYEGAQGGNVTVKSDLAAQRTLVLPPSATQRTEVFPLDGLEGELWEWGANSIGALKLLSGTIRYRPIGVYFNGAKGDVWEIEMDLGQPQHFREFELDIETEGPMQLNVSLDLPGKHISNATSFTVNTQATTAGRRIFSGRGPGTLKGQILRVRLSGGSIVRMWGGRVYLRPLNAAGSWRWIDLPIPSTNIDWMTAKLPIGSTDLGWQWINFPMDSAG